jgi:putative phage-type endonuclease
LITYHITLIKPEQDCLFWFFIVFILTLLGESIMNGLLPQLPAQPTQPPAPHRVLRLVSTHDMSREQWLAVRNKGIGSSDAAAAVGLNPYKSQLELWLEKTGRMTQEASRDDDNDPMYWGTLLESFVATHYTKKTGNKVRRVNAVLQHPEHPWMLANLDREVLGSSEVQILECKTAGMNGAKLWRDGVPEYVQLQVQHQLAVTGKQAADVAVLIAGNDFKTYRIERDEDLIQNLVALEQAFWESVEQDIPPAADGTESSARALQALYPCDSGESIDLSQDNVLSEVFSQLVAVRNDLLANEQLEAQLKQQIQERLGESSKAIFTTGEVSWKLSKDSIVFDAKSLQKEHPALYQAYQRTRAGSRRFLISTKSATA